MPFKLELKRQQLSARGGWVSYETFHLKHVADDEIGVLWDGEPVILQDLRGDPLTVDESPDTVSFFDAEIKIVWYCNVFLN